GPTFPGAVDHIEIIRDLRHEVVDVAVPVAVIGGGEKQARVVVEKDETHVVERGDFASPLRKVAVDQAQEGAKPLGASGRQGDYNGQLGHLADAAAGAAGALELCAWRASSLRPDFGNDVLQCLPAKFWRVGEELAELLKLLFG